MTVSQHDLTMTRTEALAARLAELDAEADQLAGSIAAAATALGRIGALAAFLTAVWDDGYAHGAGTAPKPAEPAPGGTRPALRLIRGGAA